MGTKISAQPLATTATAATDVAVVNVAGTTSRMTLLNIIKSMVTPSTSGNVLTSDGTNWLSLQSLRPGEMINGKISPTVSANDLVLTLLTASGGTPSASDPVYINIGGTVRAVTAALSVTKADATNWCNAGSAELATKEIDYFAYLGYNATDGVVIGFSRIPYATLYSDFSATTTNEKYAGISTIANAAAGDNYVNIGRFAATLSAGAGYTWTVPTYTTANLIQRPIYETRWLVWVPQATPQAGTYTAIRYLDIYYKAEMNKINHILSIDGTCSGTPTYIRLTLPFTTLVSQMGVMGFQNGNNAAGKFIQGGPHVDMSLLSGNFAASVYQGLSAQFFGRV